MSPSAPPIVASSSLHQYRLAVTHSCSIIDNNGSASHVPKEKANILSRLAV